MSASDDNSEWRERIPLISEEPRSQSCEAIEQRFSPPVAREDWDGIRSRYAPRLNPFTGKEELHFGIDVRVREGVPIRAIADGTVHTSDSHEAYSEYVIVRHGESGDADMVFSLSAHLQGRSVREGARVERGDIIGTAGETGDATNPHLHFELFRPGPDPYMDLDALAEPGQTHHSPRGNIYYDPSLLLCATGGEIDYSPEIEWFSPTRAPIAAAAVEHDETVYAAAAGGTVYAYDLQSGDLRWDHETEGAIRGSLTLDDGVLYAANARGRLVAFDTADGSVNWERTFDTAIVSDVLVREEVGYVHTRNAVYALDLRSEGETVWREEREETPFTSVGREAAIADDRIVSRDSHDITARSLEDGQRLWRASVTEPVYGLTADPQAGRVFATTVGGELYAIDLNSGRSLWSAQIAEEIYTDPVLIDGVLYMGARDEHMYAVSAGNGRRIWRSHVGSVVDGNAALVDDLIVFGTDDGSIVGLTPQEGLPRMRYALPDTSRIFATPVQIGDNRLAIGVEGENLADGDGMYMLDLRELSR
ncbi:MAG: PQQ-binding-like beta-propeller repeat protein [Spirochaetia bacterium]